MNLDVCSSSQGVVVAGYGLSDIQIPGWPRVPDTLQVLAPISICVECVTFAKQHRLPVRNKVNLNPGPKLRN